MPFKSSEWIEEKIPIIQLGFGEFYKIKFFIETSEESLTFSLDDVAFYEKSCDARMKF